MKTLKNSYIAGVAACILLSVQACANETGTAEISRVETASVEVSAVEATAVKTEPQSTGLVTVNADVWADNWFALYNQNELIAEDSVPFNTERSFNADSFSFEISLPAELSIVMKDFYENDTGLEYIGSRRQQVGDGGLKAQFFDASTDKLIGTSTSDWRCKVIHEAPLNLDCAYDDDPGQSCQNRIEAEPDNWRLSSFDASAWPNAIEHSNQAVRPHGGYRSVDWVSEAQLVWASDLEKDNVILCRFTLDSQ